MSTIYHPTWGDSREVPTGDVKAWKKAGWLLSPPRNKAAVEVAEKREATEGDATTDA